MTATSGQGGGGRNLVLVDVCANDHGLLIVAWPGASELLNSVDRVPLFENVDPLVVEGIRRIVNVKRLVQRLGSAQTLLERVPGRELSLFSAPEQAFYGTVDGKTPLQQLSARGPASQTENVRLLYAFFCLGLLRRMRVTASGAKKIQYKTGGLKD